MTNFFSFFKLGNHGNSKSRNGAKRNDGKAPRKRRLALESLENRELLSVSTMDFDAIKSQYADLNLTNYGDYNIIEVGVANPDNVSSFAFSDAGIRAAINAVTARSGLIVVRTTVSQNKITLGGTALGISNTTSIVAFSGIDTTHTNLTIDANNQSDVFTIGGSNYSVGLAGVTVTNGSTGISGSSGDGILRVTNCTISNNNGYGVHYMGETLLITNSTINNNAGFTAIPVPPVIHG